MIVGVDGKDDRGHPRGGRLGADQGPARHRGRAANPAGRWRQAARRDGRARRGAGAGRGRRRSCEIDTPSGPRKVAYVIFATFSRGRARRAARRDRAPVPRGRRGLLLDLRGNGGGLLNEAVLSAGTFVEDGVVVSTSARASGRQGLPGRRARRSTRSRPWSSSTATPPPPPRSWRRPFRTTAWRRWSEPGPTARTRSRRSSPSAAGGALDLTIGEYVTSEGESLAGKGVQPDVARLGRSRDAGRRGPRGGPPTSSVALLEAN